MGISQLIDEISSELSQVGGVRAVVLGGSRARGTHRPDSDIDLGIYYHPDCPLDLATLNRVATRFDDLHRTEILTNPGGWGPWINGGGWLKVNSIPVDFLYRDLSKVKGVIDSCCQGQVDIFYQPGHPLGFVSSMYMSEIAVCQLLWETKDREISTIKVRTRPFPATLKKALVDRFSWEIGFSLGIARKSIGRRDVVYASGCCFRAAMCMLQVLFALNEQYWLNEKGAVGMADGFTHTPGNLKVRIEDAFSELTDIEKTIENLSSLEAEIMELAKVLQ